MMMYVNHKLKTFSELNRQNYVVEYGAQLLIFRVGIIK
jgi:hypothetical protein